MTKIVCIGAHPDDVEQGMGGTIAKHTNREDDVHIVICTLGIGGESGDPRTRKKEAQVAASILGANLHTLDYPVLKLNKPSVEFDNIMNKIIDNLSPDRLYIHSPFDYHQVHSTVSQSVIKASKDVKQVLFYEDISSTTVEFKPNAYVDITNYIDIKIRSLYVHKTQSKKLYLQSNILRSLANTRYMMGKLGSHPNGMAEAFTIHKFIIEYSNDDDNNNIY
ncbi:MAG: PIG-L family deacetylase [Thermoproteota archaeon]|nr:PIG-L family deacetylase [Thermoproteota archaeon]